ncbi:hypothetical protein [Solilutibacter pythonis]|uniref:hypothetical protein n=1 Tax=Solilutibacter pythonis TaxID=2483112 RepID=UPI0011C3A72A|nr:hypothetical protein [Lysobacter pythonis]
MNGYRGGYFKNSAHHSINQQLRRQLPGRAPPTHQPLMASVTQQPCSPTEYGLFIYSPFNWQHAPTVRIKFITKPLRACVKNINMKILLKKNFCPFDIDNGASILHAALFFAVDANEIRPYQDRNDTPPP